MDITLGGLRPLLDGLAWSPDGSGRFPLLVLALIAVLAGAALYLPLLWRWIGIARLDRRLVHAARDRSNDGQIQREELAAFFRRSPVEFQWTEFDRRWSRAQTGGSMGEGPVRFANTLHQWPLLPVGIRRSALDALPGLLVATGILGAILVLSHSLGRPDAETGQVAIVQLVAVALRAPLWGLALAIFAGVAGRLIQGAFDHYSESLDQLVGCALGPMPDGNWPNIDEPLPLDDHTHDPGGATLAAGGAELIETTSGLIAQVSQQVSELIDQLRQAGSALQDRASAMQSSQDTLESSTHEMRGPLEQAGSSVTDQQELIQASLAEFRSTLSRLGERVDEDPRPADQDDPRPTEPDDPPSREPRAEDSPVISAGPSGRWLGPDPYAKKDREADLDFDRVDPLLDSQGLGLRDGPVETADRTASLAEASRGLSGLLARPRPRLREFLGKTSDSAGPGVEPREPKEAESSPALE